MGVDNTGVVGPPVGAVGSPGALQAVLMFAEGAPSDAIVSRGSSDM